MTNGDKLIKSVLELERINRKNAEIEKETQAILKAVDSIDIDAIINKAIKQAKEITSKALARQWL